MRIKHDTTVGLGAARVFGLREHAVSPPPVREPLGWRYTAVKGDREVTLLPAGSEPEQLAIFEMREHAYRTAGLDYLLGSAEGRHPAADEFDAGSMHLCGLEGGQLIGSVRHAPTIDGQWESPEITRLSALTPFSPGELLQLGRLVVAPECRGHMLSELLAWASIDWIGRSTAYRGFFSVCAPRLARFYEHFGTTIVEGVDATLAERDHKVYSLIYASYESCRNTLHRFLSDQGWELHYPMIP